MDHVSILKGQPARERKALGALAQMSVGCSVTCGLTICCFQCGSDVAMILSILVMTSRENGPTCRYSAIIATNQRIESGLSDMH
jgi:hypothetical protein